MSIKFVSARMALALALGLMVFGGAFAALAQGEPYMELLRKDLQADKVAIMTGAMALTEEQGEVFWPIYREYQTKLSEIGDRRIALIKDYATNYESMAPEKAKEMTDLWFKQQKDRLSLMEKTAKKVGKDIDPITAMRFLQVENALNLAIDLQLTSEIPLLKYIGDDRPRWQTSRLVPGRFFLPSEMWPCGGHLG